METSEAYSNSLFNSVAIESPTICGVNRRTVQLIRNEILWELIPRFLDSFSCLCSRELGTSEGPELCSVTKDASLLYLRQKLWKPMGFFCPRDVITGKKKQLWTCFGTIEARDIPDKLSLETGFSVLGLGTRHKAHKACQIWEDECETLCFQWPGNFCWIFVPINLV